MRCILAFVFVPVLIGLQPAVAASNPLAPLTADEIRAAAKLFRSSDHFPAGAAFSQITLEEPAKEMVLAKTSVPRRAFAVSHCGIEYEWMTGLAE